MFRTYLSGPECGRLSGMPIEPFSGKALSFAATIATLVVASIHFYILYLEMFRWDSPAGRKAFGLQPEFATSTKVMAANQGLYNGFLGTGLVWGAWCGSCGDSVKIFFLGCVVVAGVFGAATAARKILFIQALPGLIALALVLLAGRHVG